MRDAGGGDWEKVRAAFHDAMDRPLAERVPFIEGRLADEPEALAEVRELLESHAAAAGFLNENQEASPLSGRRIGPYRLIAEIARGGMGSVVLAVRDDGEFHQRVAIKLLKRGMDTDEIVRRFRAERQALAALDHPHIARVLDGGTTAEGLPYFVMEYIDGEPIDEYCRRVALSRRARLLLFLKVCHAVSHAHQLLIVHRDIKPGNVLVREEAEGEPAPKLLDFGLAKLISSEATLDDATSSLVHGAWMTPAYASPEQIRGEAIGTPTDVYSLGALLYCLMAGRPPFETEGLGAAELARMAAERPVPALDGGRGRSDLDTILKKALDPDLSLRYASVEGFALDVRRWLEGQPITARPSTFAYRARRFLRRNALAVASIAAVFVFLATALALVLIQAREIREESAARREINEFLRWILASVDPANEGRDVDFLRVVERAAERVEDEFADRPLVRVTLQDTLGQTFHRLGRYREARGLLEAGLATCRAEAEGHGPLLADSLDHLADLLIDLGEYDRAGELLVESLSRRQAAGDPVRLAETHNLVGLLHYWRSDFDQGERHVRRALLLQREHLGEWSEPAALSYNNLALIHQERDQGAEAIRCLERSVEIERHLFDRPHPGLATGLYNLGCLLHKRACLEDARRHLEEAVALRRELFGERHLDTALATAKLGNVLLELGDHERSERLVRAAYAVIGELASRESFDYASASFDLGKVLEGKGAFAEAAEAYEESLAIYRRWGDTNSAPSLVGARIIACRVAAGQHDVAEERIDAFLQTMADGAGGYRNVGHVGEVIASRARILLERGEREASERALAEALAIPTQEQWGWRLVWALELESDLALARGDLDAARAARVEALACLDRRLPGGSVVRSWLQHGLGRVEWQAGATATAEALLRESGETLGRLVPAGHPWLDVVEQWRARLGDG